MRVLVCGGRDWTDRECIRAILDGMVTGQLDPLLVIEGGAKGADSIAGEWAHDWHPTHADRRSFPADWATHGKGAGPIRNQKMLNEGKPDVVWAFVTRPLAESRGTADMVRRAVAAGVPTYVVQTM